MVGDLGGFDGLSWIVGGYLLASTIVVPFAGKLADLYGTNRLFQISILLFAIGSVIAGRATSVEMLVAARVLQGLGGGAILTLSFTLVALARRSTRARPLPGLHRVAVHGCQRRRAADRRLLRRPSLVALDLLHDRRRVPRRPPVRAPQPPARRETHGCPVRSRRELPARRQPRRRDADRDVGRAAARLDVAGAAGAGGAHARRGGRLRSRRTPRHGAGDAARPVPPALGPGRDHPRLPDGGGDDDRADLRSDLRPARARCQRRGVGTPPDAAHAVRDVGEHARRARDVEDRRATNRP